MNTQNADFLKDKLKYLGFGDKLNAELEKNINTGKERFEISAQAEFQKGDKKEKVDYLIDFSKSKQNDMYFVNKYQATLKDSENQQDKSQTFYLNKGNGVTAKEAFNMLEGRAVFKKLTKKEGKEYEAWLQLADKKEENGNHKIQQYHSAWGYDINSTLNKLPIKELQDTEQRDKLIKSLEKGNLQSVTFKRDDKEEKMYLEASPKDKSIIVYDEHMRKQFQNIKEHKAEKNEIKEGKQENNSQKQKAQEPKEESEPGEKKTRGRRM